MKFDLTKECLVAGEENPDDFVLTAGWSNVGLDWNTRFWSCCNAATLTPRTRTAKTKAFKGFLADSSDSLNRRLRKDSHKRDSKF